MYPHCLHYSTSVRTRLGYKANLCHLMKVFNCIWLVMVTLRCFHSHDQDISSQEVTEYGLLLLEKHLRYKWCWLTECLIEIKMFFSPPIDVLSNPLSEMHLYSGHQNKHVKQQHLLSSQDSCMGFYIYIFFNLWSDLVLVLCPQILWCNFLIEITTANPIDKRTCLRLEINW